MRLSLGFESMLAKSQAFLLAGEQIFPKGLKPSFQSGLG